ncbi:MAG TPA: DUF5995 family protein [Gaiellaceae bacterium]|nr:DUF5995 family protein [Gaiellaceae bacterium]
MTLEQVLRAPPAARIEGVLERMLAIEAALPRDDGIACFTRLYRAVTEAVLETTDEDFADARFVRWLDVVFANLYFRALQAFVLGRGRVPHAWAPLFRERTRPGIAPLQFALAGMNAHINRDLPVALLQTCTARKVPPRHGSPQHEDFSRVDGLLEETEARVKHEYAVGLVGVADEALGRLDDVLAIWKVSRARQAAWVHAETLWHLRALPFAGARHLAMLDRTVGFAGRGLLARVL